MSTTTASRLIPLDWMQSGESGTIFDVDGRDDVVHRLSEMGLSKGVAVRMVRSGKPCILVVGDHRLSLRLDDNVQVLVEVVS